MGRNELTWYDQLREKYRPAQLRVLLIAESPPDPGDGKRRFFYSSTLSQHDNLFRGVAAALYGDMAVYQRPKTSILENLQADGFWLIDAVEQPINKLSKSERRRAIKSGVSGLAERCIQLAPGRGVVICHGEVYAQAADGLSIAGVNVLHKNALPFPLGNWRADFVAGMRQALGPTQTGTPDRTGLAQELRV